MAGVLKIALLIVRAITQIVRGPRISAKLEPIRSSNGSARECRR